MRNALFVRALTFAAVACLILSDSATIVRAADHDFSAIVAHISRQYHTISNWIACTYMATRFWARNAGSP